jgi:hypothetical protein
VTKLYGLVMWARTPFSPDVLEKSMHFTVQNLRIMALSKEDNVSGVASVMMDA